MINFLLRYLISNYLYLMTKSFLPIISQKFLIRKILMVKATNVFDSVQNSPKDVRKKSKSSYTAIKGLLPNKFSIFCKPFHSILELKFLNLFTYFCLDCIIIRLSRASQVLVEY